MLRLCCPEKEPKTKIRFLELSKPGLKIVHAALASKTSEAKAD